MNIQKRGFTLIELLVVVLIIGIPAAVALPQYQKAVEKARAAEAMTVINTLQKAIDMWLLENTIPDNGVTFFGLDDHDPVVGGSGLENNRDSVTLNIDISCDGYPLDVEGTAVCSTSNFTYLAQCYPDACLIQAPRVSDASIYDRGMLYKGEDYWIFGETDLYTLSSTKNLVTGKWTNSCNGSLCSSLNWK